MNRTTVAVLCAVALVVGIGVGAALKAAGSRSSPADIPPANSQHPLSSTVITIDFTKRHDLHCAHPGGAVTVYRRCKVLGFTGRGELPPAYRRYPVEYAEVGRCFDSWLAVELEDGRQAYLPPNSITSLEVSAADGSGAQLEEKSPP